MLGTWGSFSSLNRSMSLVVSVTYPRKGSQSPGGKLSIPSILESPLYTPLHGYCLIVSLARDDNLLSSLSRQLMLPVMLLGNQGH